MVLSRHWSPDYTISLLKPLQRQRCVLAIETCKSRSYFGGSCYDRLSSKCRSKPDWVHIAEVYLDPSNATSVRPLPSPLECYSADQTDLLLTESTIDHPWHTSLHRVFLETINKCLEQQRLCRIPSLTTFVSRFYNRPNLSTRTMPFKSRGVDRRGQMPRASLSLPIPSLPILAS